MPVRVERIPSQRSTDAARASLALHNLRGVSVAFVVMAHAFAAYLAVDSKGYAFDQPPHGWQATPVLDRSRWLGFDVFCGWQDSYPISPMFFLSGVSARASTAAEASNS